MTSLGTVLDDRFVAEMAARFPRSAFSAMSGRHVRSLQPSPSVWAADYADISAVEASLVAQLGILWGGLEAEPPVRRTALSILGAYAAGCDVGDILADINLWATVAAGGGTACDISVLLTPQVKEAAAPIIAKAASGHAWSATVALAIVQAAKRSNGVLPNAHFLWLAVHDRPLWLLLTGFGRNEPGIETLGVIAHSAAEIVMGRPLTTVLLASVAAEVKQDRKAK